MATGQLLQMVNGLVEELSPGECSRLAFLCGAGGGASCVGGAGGGASGVGGAVGVVSGVGGASGAPDLRELLRTRVTRGEVDLLYLGELMLRMKRFDLLSKVLRISKQEVETGLGCRKVVPEYRLLIADVSEDMATEDLQSLLFLLSDTLPRQRIDNVKSFIEVVVELEKLDRVSPERVELIERCLRNIGRVDLAKRVGQYQRRVGTSQHQSAVPLDMDEQRRGWTTSYAIPSCTPTAAYSPRHGKAQDLHIPQRVHTPPSESRRPYCHTQSPVDEYHLQPAGPGVCVIIDCVGSDGDMLEQTFIRLRFKVVLAKCPGVEETLSLLRGVARGAELQGGGALACCIISRATPTHLLATDPPHGAGIRLDALRGLFSPHACPRLAGRPKLFFIQSYGVTTETRRYRRDAHRDEDLETDGPAGHPRLVPVELVPADADVFWSLCCTEEGQLEVRGHRSVYLQALSQALLRGQRRRTHLVDVHTEVNREIFDHNRRSPGASYNIHLRHTLRKNLYLL